MNHTVQSFDDLDAVFTALANRHRREVVIMLAVRPASVQQVAARVGLSLPAIHRHVRLLETAHLVRRTKVGRVNLLALERSSLRLLQTWTGQFAPGWGTDAETLRYHAAPVTPTAPITPVTPAASPRDDAGTAGTKGTNP